MKIAELYQLAGDQFQHVLLNSPVIAQSIIEEFARDQLELDDEQAKAFAEAALKTGDTSEIVTHLDINNLHLWYFINYIATFVFMNGVNHLGQKYNP